MTRDIPDNVDHARSLLVDVATTMSLSVESKKTAWGPDVLSLSGKVDGVHIDAEVTIRSAMGAASYDIESTARIHPSLGLALKLAPGGIPIRGSRRHLPPAWDNHPETAHLVAIESEDPVSVAAILSEVGVPEFVVPQDSSTTGLKHLTDHEVAMRVHQLGRSREVVQHLRHLARWTSTVIAAGTAYQPVDHAAMPSKAWRIVQNAHGGELDFRARRYHLVTSTTTLELQARYHADDDYRLFGELQWPSLPFKTLKLTPQAEQSWLRRLLSRDVVIGREEFDRAFIIDATPTAQLDELVTERVAQSALGLLSLTGGLTIQPNGACFKSREANLDAESASQLVATAVELGQAMAAALSPSRGAYR